MNYKIVMPFLSDWTIQETEDPVDGKRVFPSFTAARLAGINRLRILKADVDRALLIGKYMKKSDIKPLKTKKA